MTSADPTAVTLTAAQLSDLVESLADTAAMLTEHINDQADAIVALRLAAARQAGDTGVTRLLDQIDTLWRDSDLPEKESDITRWLCAHRIPYFPNVKLFFDAIRLDLVRGIATRTSAGQAAAMLTASRD